MSRMRSIEPIDLMADVLRDSRYRRRDVAKVQAVALEVIAVTAEVKAGGEVKEIKSISDENLHPFLFNFPIPKAIDIESKHVKSLFDNDLVMIKDCSGISGFGRTRDTICMNWGRASQAASIDSTIPELKDAKKNWVVPFLYSMKATAHHSTLMAIKAEEKVEADAKKEGKALPHHSDELRGYCTNLKQAPNGIFGFIVIWSVSCRHPIIGRLSESKNFEEVAWWRTHEGKSLTFRAYKRIDCRMESW